MTSKPVTALPAGPPPSSERTPSLPGAPAAPRTPPRRAARSSNVWLIAGLAVLLVTGLGAAILLPGFKTGRTDLILHKVKRETLHLTIVERGQLESANNRDIVCRVRAGDKANATTIKWVIEDGSYVTTGQEVVRLDASGLEEKRTLQKIEMDRAENDWVAAKEQLDITLSDNVSQRGTADVNIQLAEIDKEKYWEGDYQSARKLILSNKSLAESDVQMWLDRAAWSERMVKKKFLTPTQAAADRARLRSAQLSLEKYEEELRVLEKYTKVQEGTKRQSTLDEAIRKRATVEATAVANESKCRKDLDTKYSVYLNHKSKYDELEEEIEKCVLRAPADGLVVYYVPAQSRWGSGSKQTVIAQGEPVSEGQKLLQIPDLKHMLVNTRVHEAMVGRVKGEEFKRTGFGDAIMAASLVNPFADARMLGVVGYPAARDQDEGQHMRDRDLIKIYDGQRAQVKIEAFSSKPLDAHVKSVATVASQQDWSSDVAVYQTMVEIHESFNGLRPGMKAEVTIFTNEKAEYALTVPVQAVVRLPGRTAGHRVYVKTDEGIEARDVVIGLSNEKMIEIKKGIDEGDEVISNPLVLDEEKSRPQTESPDEGSRPGPGGPGGPGKAPGKGGRVPGGPGAPGAPVKDRPTPPRPGVPTAPGPNG